MKSRMAVRSPARCESCLGSTASYTLTYRWEFESVVSGKALVVPTDNAVFSYHGEARVAVWFGPDVFSRAGVRPYLFLSGGFAESDGRIVVDFKVPGDANTYKLDAWKRSGHTFVSPGFGIQAAVTKSMGPVAEVRYMQYFSPNVPVIAAQFGWAVGF